MLLDVIEVLWKNFENEHVVGVFFDFDKAYGTMWTYSIIRLVRVWPKRSPFFFFINNFLNDRLFRVRVGYLVIRLCI